MKTLTKLLVANRGEIALRVMKTARKMGLGTVAVFSDADANAPHVKFADEAVRIGPAPSRDSYLSTEAILCAAKRTGADCVHPGYGFLSENPDFAQAVTDAGLTFIGPTPEAIRAMGLKREAKALVGARGVPLVPGFDGGDQSIALLEKKALEVGLPVIFKPSAGGGGKGMKIARKPEELREAIESGQREAKSAFGDATLIIEMAGRRLMLDPMLDPANDARLLNSVNTWTGSASGGAPPTRPSKSQTSSSADAVPAPAPSSASASAATIMTCRITAVSADARPGLT